jgi:hypothetical protein
LSNWKFLWCFASRETIRQGEISRGETSGHKSGGLVSVLASGSSACPKNARDLTLMMTCINLEVGINMKLGLKINSVQSMRILGKLMD